MEPASAIISRSTVASNANREVKSINRSNTKLSQNSFLLGSEFSIGFKSGLYGDIKRRAQPTGCAFLICITPSAGTGLPHDYQRTEYAHFFRESGTRFLGSC